MTDSEIEKMMVIGSMDGTDDVVEQPAEEPAQTPAPETADGTIRWQESEITSVSDVILQNTDKYVNCQVLNDVVHGANADADVRNYIVYVNTVKKIPCVYDCERLYVPTEVVKNPDGTWKVTSIEGRRSGFVIKTADTDLVMTKNFIYVCTMDVNGNIAKVVSYGRVHKLGLIGEVVGIRNGQEISLDAAKMYIKVTLPKLYKNSNGLDVQHIRAAVVNEYSNVNDINAMIKIIQLRLQIGC